MASLSFMNHCVHSLTFRVNACKSIKEQVFFGVFLLFQPSPLLSWFPTAKAVICGQELGLKNQKEICSASEGVDILAFIGV